MLRRVAVQNARLPTPNRTPRSHYATQASGGLDDPTTYCRNLVRKHDYDSLLCSYFYPRRTQPAYFALKAFNVELAMVRESVSKPTIGQMRMQFWRDAIKAIQKDRPPQHPIALALHGASQEFHLPAYYLTRLIDARDADLYAPTHQTISSMTTYGESTGSTLLYLLLSLLSQSSSSTLAHAASHIGVATSLTTLLRALPFHASKGRMVIPAEVCAKHGVREEGVFRYGGSAEGIRDAVYDFACVANEHVLSAREVLEGSVPREAMPVFLSAVPTVSYLERLEKANFDAFDAGLLRRDWRLPFRIWRANSRRTF